MKQNATTLEDVFGPPISVYTRAQALENGVLVDVSTTAKEAGIKFPVALTQAVWTSLVAWTPEDVKRSRHAGQSVAGRLWDVIWMARVAIKLSPARRTEIHYKVYAKPRPGHERQRLHTLKMVCGPGDAAEPVITIMLPEED